MLASHDEAKSEPVPPRERVTALRRRRQQQGRSYVTVELPKEIVEFIDRLKTERRLIGRTRVIEEALREFIKKHERA